MFRDLTEQLQSAIDGGVSVDDAAEAVKRFILGDSTRVEPVVEEAVRIASRYVTRARISAERTKIWNRAASIAERRGETTKRLREKVAGLMAFRLPAGKPLGDCTGTEVRKASELYAQLARTEHQRSAWLAEIARRAGKRLVRNALTETQLQDLYEKATSGELDYAAAG